MNCSLRHLYLSFLFATTYLLIGCAGMYIPSSPNIPLLSEKKETKINLGASTNSLFINGAYAFNDNKGLIFNGNISYGNFSNHEDIIPEVCYLYIFCVDGYGNHRNAELGYGLFNLFKKSEKYRYEIYGGLGYGRANNGEYYNKYSTLFLQSNMGLKLDKVEMGLSGKIIGGYLNYNDYQFGKWSTESNTMFSLEIAGVIRTGGEHLKFFFSPGFQLVEQESSYTNLGLLRFHLSMGCTINLYGNKRVDNL